MGDGDDLGFGRRARGLNEKGGITGRSRIPQRGARPAVSEAKAGRPVRIGGEENEVPLVRQSG